MNEDQKAKVYGSYNNPEEIAEAITQLRDEGYSREQIRVYSNTGEPMTAEEVRVDLTENTSNLEEQSNTVIISDTKRNEDLGKEPSFWDQVKDFFTPDKYDYDEEAQNEHYRIENDILYPHREELAQGHRIIVLDKANENQTRINI